MTKVYQVLDIVNSIHGLTVVSLTKNDPAGRTPNEEEVGCLDHPDQQAVNEVC